MSMEQLCKKLAIERCQQRLAELLALLHLEGDEQGVYARKGEVIRGLISDINHNLSVLDAAMDPEYFGFSEVEEERVA